MTWLRAVVALALAGAVGAGVVALVSRTPARVRLDKPPPAATDPSLGASFSDEQIGRHGSYRGPTYLAFVLGIAVEITALVVLARGPIPALYRSIENIPGRWVLPAALLAVVIALALWAVALPLSFVRGYAMQQAWGLSTQDVGGWFTDQLRSLLVASITGVIAAVAFFAIVRWQPRLWWLIGWGAFTALSAFLVFIYPVTVAPLFNEFTPVKDARLADRIKGLASEAGIDVDEVLVADASRRTTAENAYVAGLGSTKRVVVFDTLLASGSDEDTLFVVAHELGHRAERHLVKGLAVASGGLLVAFAILRWLASRSGAWSWADATGIADLRALPVLILFAAVVGVLALPAQNAVSRRFEATADAVAVRLTGESGTAVRSFRRLAFSNIADLSPPGAAVWTLFSHPPIPERIRNVLDRSQPGT